MNHTFWLTCLRDLDISDKDETTILIKESEELISTNSSFALLPSFL